MTFRRFFKVLGPGLITGAADDDPSGISTYSVAGAGVGLSVLWLAVLTTPMMSVVQGMCARIGMVTGLGLGAAMRKHVPRWIVYPLMAAVVAANTFNIGADLEGMGASTNMVLGLPVPLWILAFAAVLVIVNVFFSYKLLAAVLKYLALSLLAYVITAFIVHPDWGMVLRAAVVPQVHLNASWLVTVVGVLGTTISPYLFFWQSSLMVEEEKEGGRKTIAERRGATAVEISDAHLDVNVGMFASNAVMFFIIVTTAVTLGAHGIHNIDSAQQAARALRPLAGDYAYLLFALGMVGTGLLSIPALAGSSAYVVSEMFAFRQGLGEKLQRAWRFYSVFAFGILAGTIMGLLHVDPIKMLFWSAVLNGVVAVPLVPIVVLLASNEGIMGEWASSTLARLWGWFTAVVMAAAAAGMFLFWGKQ